VAKILVADDNSNVQKTVALALADLGVEVIAVNNGEAAVRKLSDVLPDLVLADIFMPVRNGYEVCEYVKKDSRFSHVPVVLLVGAFDPLDEREAQRVGADGILKKPFVPPDPLITMVKTLLERTLGDRLVAVGASKPAVSMQSKAGGVAAVPAHPAAPETADEFPMEEVQPPVDRLSFGDGERPIAFGQLLETPGKETAATGSVGVEPVDDEQILTSSRDASLGDPIFWRTEDPEPGPEEENLDAEGDISSGLPMRPWKVEEEAPSRPAEADFLQPVEPFELVREEKDQEAGQPSTIVESSPLIVQDAASQASLTVEAAKPEDLAANPIEWMASVPPPTEEEPLAAAPEWGAADTDGTDNLHAREADNFESAPEPVAPESPAAVVAPVSVSRSAPALPSTPPPSSAPTPTQPYDIPLAQKVEDTARSILKQDWTDLSANLQTKSIDSVAEKSKSPSVPAAQHLPVTTANTQPESASSQPPVLKPLTPSVEDTARSILKQDWADLSANLQTKSIDSVAEKGKPPSVPVAKTLPVTTANAQPESPSSQPPDLKPLTQGTEDTARSIRKHDWADLTASLQTKPIEPVAEKPKPSTATVAQDPVVPPANAPLASSSATQIPAAAAVNAQPTSANSAPPALPDQALVEAVVQRVLDKMRPQVVDIITKEFLRPVVQALVSREIQKR
jgi:CheY-like chemotaxis protein